jgi:hypothetical protein
MNYKAGLPFPMVDVNDPQAATKIMWNFEFRPLNTDDLDAPHIEAVSRGPGQSEPMEVMSFGHFGYYKSIGRTEVEPSPIDKAIYQTGPCLPVRCLPGPRARGDAWRRDRPRRFRPAGR